MTVSSLASRAATHQVHPTPEEEEVINELNNSISILERAALSVNGHTANSLNLRAKINRQLAARKEQLQQLSRESSVILPVPGADPVTSTPNLSPNLTQTQAFFSPDVSPSIGPGHQRQSCPGFDYFCQEEDAGSKTGRSSGGEPQEPGLSFEIYQDSSQNPPINPVQKIPVVETPSTAFSGADKENICAFQFGPAINVTEYTVSQEQELQESQEVNMDDEDAREAIKKFGRTCNKLKSFCNSHQVDRTPAKLLVHHETKKSAKKFDV